MDTEARMQAFLTRLWDLQGAAGMKDVTLARAMGVDQSLITRAKRDAARTCGTKFLLGACSVFPELRFILWPDLSTITSDVSEVKDEGAA